MNVSLGSHSAVYLVRENITDCLLFYCSNCTPLLSLQQPPTHLSAGVLSQGLELTRQVHYHWATCPAMLYGFIFIWSLFCSPTAVCKTCALCPSSQLKACVVRRSVLWLSLRSSPGLCSTLYSQGFCVVCSFGRESISHPCFSLLLILLRFQSPSSFQ